MMTTILTHHLFLNVWRCVVLVQMALVVGLLLHSIWRTVPFLRAKPVHEVVLGRVLVLLAIVIFIFNNATSIVGRFGHILNYRTPIAQVGLILVLWAWTKTYKSDLKTLEQVVREHEAANDPA